MSPQPPQQMDPESQLLVEEKGYGSTFPNTNNAPAKAAPQDVSISEVSLPGKNIPTTFLEDLRSWRNGTVEGTIPQSFCVAIVVGIACGGAAFLYYKSLWAVLDYLWHDLPQDSGFKDAVPESLWFLWIAIIGFTMSAGVGLSVKYLGEPGDLAYVVKCVHNDAYIHESHMIPMIAASQFSILGGGSLGPEAPLVAICAGVAGWLSRNVFKTVNKNVVRKHTLMGMCAALAAFFGAPLGGSLFALEINNRFGVEYFEHALEAIFAGEICLAMFRYLAGLPIAPIWDLGAPLTEADPVDVLCGILIGLCGAAVAGAFAWFHGRVMKWFASRDLLDNSRAVPRALTGAVVIVILGLLVPQTMFWGEYELQTILTLGPAEDLEHIWPTSGLLSFEMNSFWSCFIVGLCKMIVISFTVAGGYRGGFIFPFFAAGAAFGRALCFLFPSLPPSIACLCFAAGINVSITRTVIGTTCILAFLAGEQNAMSSILAASLVAQFATAYMPFIKSQKSREDMDKAHVYEYSRPLV